VAGFHPIEMVHDAIKPDNNQQRPDCSRNSQAIQQKQKTDISILVKTRQDAS